ncbi:hypothetical protein AOLI_G00064800 [Acnodon oligacanthus]
MKRTFPENMNLTYMLDSNWEHAKSSRHYGGKGKPFPTESYKACCLLSLLINQLWLFFLVSPDLQAPLEGVNVHLYPSDYYITESVVWGFVNIDVSTHTQTGRGKTLVTLMMNAERLPSSHCSSDSFAHSDSLKESFKKSSSFKESPGVLALCARKLQQRSEMATRGKAGRGAKRKADAVKEAEPEDKKNKREEAKQDEDDQGQRVIIEHCKS